MTTMASRARIALKPNPPPPAPPASISPPHKQRTTRTKPVKEEILFIDVDAERRPSSCSATGGATYNRIDPKDILAQNDESGPEAVYEIILRGEQFRKIEHLDSFKKCRSLDLSSNCIETLQNLNALRDLRELKIYDNRIPEIKNLEQLTELNCLQLQHNCISTIGTGLNKLKKLKVLRLDSNEILEINVKQLTSCSWLTSLDLSYNQIQDITPLNCLPNLEELRVSNNRLKQVQDLGRCRKLEDIDLSGNKLVDVSGLKGLPVLSVVDLSRNLLSSLASTGCLRKLKDLNLSENRFRDVTRLVSAFSQLEILRIGNNRIEEWAEFLKLANLENLVEVYLDGNPAYDNMDNHVSANQELSSAITQLDILNGALIHRKTRSTTAPLMRPMSANAIISVKHVQHQIRTMESEICAFELDLSKKFESMTSSLTALPASAPQELGEDDVGESSRPLTASRQSRCSSRSKLRDAMAYASTAFDDV